MTNDSSKRSIFFSEEIENQVERLSMDEIQDLYNTCVRNKHKLVNYQAGVKVCCSCKKYYTFFDKKPVEYKDLPPNIDSKCC
ncbi:hypothetical protein [Acinetobacter sp. 1000160]|uniref:hypothetical protein n=1 Tax=Acinetobacter sp. 1000160 TaxID=1310800 RepID=UPI00044C03C2|nr:hypothetical protein [Acinetobacter sp. 1000160]EXB49434.1 hypothetical protein J522_1013 [Acinetobacter baumannii 146457]